MNSIGNMEHRTEARECEAHGPYEAKLFRFHKNWHGGDCPTCAEANEREKQEREREQQRARHVAHMLGIAGIPRRFADATLASYLPQTDRAEKVLDACRRYVDTWRERRAKGSSLILSGNVGTGKTHLACAIASTLIHKYGICAKYLTVMQAMQRIRATYAQGAGESEHTVLERIAAVDLLILDEVGVQSGSAHEHAMLFEIINRRYSDVLPTIVISNLGAKELAAAIGERLVDRLRENGAVLTFGWDSYRGVA